jgi:hypothetical protein
MLPCVQQRLDNQTPEIAEAASNHYDCHVGGLMMIGRLRFG